MGVPDASFLFAETRDAWPGQFRHYLNCVRAFELRSFPVEGDGSASVAFLARRRVVRRCFPCPILVDVRPHYIVLAVRLGGGPFAYERADLRWCLDRLGLTDEPDSNAVVSAKWDGETGTFCIALDRRASHVFLWPHPFEDVLSVFASDEEVAITERLTQGLDDLGYRRSELPVPDGTADVRLSAVARWNGHDWPPHVPTAAELAGDMDSTARVLAVVPAGVNSVIEVARLCYVRGWHQWELFTVGVQYALFALESVLRAAYVQGLGPGPVVLTGSDENGAEHRVEVQSDYGSLWRAGPGAHLHAVRVNGVPFPSRKPALVDHCVRHGLLSLYEAKRARHLLAMRDRFAHPDHGATVQWISHAHGDIASAVRLVNLVFARLSVELAREPFWDS